MPELTEIELDLFAADLERDEGEEDAETAWLEAGSEEYALPFALPNTRILLHQPSIGGGLGGQVSDVEIHARELMHTKQRLNEILASMTGQPFEKIERDTDRDYMLGAQAAVEYGVIDQVVNRPGDGSTTQGD